MSTVFSDEEVSVGGLRGVFEFLTPRDWLFRSRRISRVDPMEAEDFLHLFRVRLNLTRQCSSSHHHNSYHLLRLFDWHLDVMVHHGVHVGITSALLAESHLVIALRKYEHWAVHHGLPNNRFGGAWDVVRSVARRIKRRLLKMSRENSRAVEGE